MPNSYIQSLVDKGHGSLDELEKKWKEAKKLAKERNQEDNYAYIMSIFKKLAKIEECIIMSFKSYIEEKIDPAKYIEKQQKEASLFLGRMQPIHIGHDAIIKSMKGTKVVALVKGSKSSKDKDRNPFDAEYQMKLIHMLNPSVKSMVAPTGYIPDIINELRKEGIEIKHVYAGKDRLQVYKRQIASFNSQVPKEKQIDIKFHETPRITSATKVREAIRNGDYDTFKKLVPKELHREWDTMRKMMS